MGQVACIWGHVQHCALQLVALLSAARGGKFPLQGGVTLPRTSIRSQTLVDLQGGYKGGLCLRAQGPIGGKRLPVMLDAELFQRFVHLNAPKF